jgi:hypothetical protein
MAGRHHRVDHLAGYLACRGRQPAIAQTESENRPPGSCDKTRSRAFGCHAVTSNSPEQRTVAAEGEALRMLRYTGPNGHARTRIPPIIRLSMDASRPTNHAHPDIDHTPGGDPAPHRERQSPRRSTLGPSTESTPRSGAQGTPRWGVLRFRQTPRQHCSVQQLRRAVGCPNAPAPRPRSRQSLAV